MTFPMVTFFLFISSQITSRCEVAVKGSWKVTSPDKIILPIILSLSKEVTKLNKHHLSGCITFKLIVAWSIF
jgi:hypothetical protein